ncbi:MAG: hypothetical protein ACXAC7_01820 [Candidatus Hodarchaeales archaeon]|jgi:hypothetical protein
MRAQLVFNTWESKHFIAKSIVHHPIVKKSLEKGIIAVSRGITNSFVLKELLKKTGNSDFEVDLNNYVAGVVDGSLWASNKEFRAPEVAFYKGVPEFKPVNKVIHEMSTSDLIIKGGNALGTDWVAGVLCAHPEGGTIGSVYPISVVKGIKILIPISVGKMIPYPITDITPALGGQDQIDYVRGTPVGLFPVVNGEIFSEIEALNMIGNHIEVYPIGAGGVYDGAGATIFEIEGLEDDINNIIEHYEQVKNTSPLKISLKPHHS